MRILLGLVSCAPERNESNEITATIVPHANLALSMTKFSTPLDIGLSVLPVFGRPLDPNLRVPRAIRAAVVIDRTD